MEDERTVCLEWCACNPEDTRAIATHTVAASMQAYRGEKSKPYVSATDQQNHRQEILKLVPQHRNTTRKDADGAPVREGKELDDKAQQCADDGNKAVKGIGGVHVCTDSQYGCQRKTTAKSRQQVGTSCSDET